MKKDVHYIDCGANIGQSIQWALSKFSVLKIDAFEPLEYNFLILINKYGNYSNIYLHQEAVWIKNGILDFYIDNSKKKLGSSLIKGKRVVNGGSVKVICVDLLKWIQKNVNSQNHNILKMDIEGAEYDVLPYLLNNGIEEYIDEFFVEFHGGKTPNRNIEFENKFKLRSDYTDWGFCE